MTLPDFPSVTHNFGLPLLFVGQSQREGHINEAFVRIDALTHLTIKGKQTVPPGDPADGECWLVETGAEQDWLDKDGQIAMFASGNWLFAKPREGMTLYDCSTQQQARFVTSWNYAAAPELPTGGAVIDAEARATIGQILAALQVAGLVRL